MRKLPVWLKEKVRKQYLSDTFVAKSFSAKRNKPKSISSFSLSRGFCFLLHVCCYQRREGAFYFPSPPFWSPWQKKKKRSDAWKSNPRSLLLLLLRRRRRRSVRGSPSPSHSQHKRINLGKSKKEIWCAFSLFRVPHKREDLRASLPSSQFFIPYLRLLGQKGPFRHGGFWQFYSALNCISLLSRHLILTYGPSYYTQMANDFWWISMLQGYSRRRPERLFRARKTEEEQEVDIGKRKGHGLDGGRRYSWGEREKERLFQWPPSLKKCWTKGVLTWLSFFQRATLSFFWKSQKEFENFFGFQQNAVV